MRIMNHFTATLCLTLLASATQANGKSETTLPYAGQIKPRRARTIRSSNWPVARSNVRKRLGLSQHAAKIRV